MTDTGRGLLPGSWNGINLRVFALAKEAELKIDSERRAAFMKDVVLPGSEVEKEPEVVSTNLLHTKQIYI